MVMEYFGIFYLISEDINPLMSNVAAPPDFGKSVNPIQARGHIIPTTLLLAPPPQDFQTFLRP